jgi:hypothetical protein
MHGLCHTYRLDKAHYFCWSQSQGVLMAELTWDPRLWTEVLLPRYREFADLWAVRALPGRMDSVDKKELIAKIREMTFISALSRTPQPPSQQ